MQLLKGVRGDVAANIKKMPDLVIHDPTVGKFILLMSNSGK
jgi:hypothetical protein